MKKNTEILAIIGLALASTIGCQPRTPAQKAEDKMEDAAHEAKQGIERAGENIDNSVNKK